MAPTKQNFADWQFGDILKAFVSLLSGEGINAALASLGEGADVDRVYVFTIHPHPKTGELACSQLYEWCRPGIEPQIDNPELQNLSLERAGFGRWLEAFQKGEVIFGRVAEFPDHERSLLEAQGIKSILVAPIRCKGELLGFVGFDSVNRLRDWKKEHREALLVVAASLGEHLLRQEAWDELAKAEQQWRTLLAQLPDAVVVHDGQKIVFANAEANRFFGLPEGKTLVGRAGAQVVHPSAWSAVQERVAAMLSKGEPAPILELAYTREDGSTFVAETCSAPVVLGGRKLIVSVLRDLSERKRWLEQIQHLAYHDSLTDLPNRRMLRERSEQLLALARRHKFPVALGYLDLDRFKEVNDTLGHDAGDELLQAVALRLARVARATDTVARLGGDEFAILWPQTGHEGARAVGRRILECFDQPFLVGQELISVEASLGIAVFPTDGQSLEQLMRSADVAMYRAKAAKCGCAFYSRELDRYSRERLAFLGKIKKAIKEQAVSFHYQPILCAETGRAHFVETLARLEEGGEVIVASFFVPLLQEVGLLAELDRLALRQAAQAVGHLGIPVTVNVAGPSLFSPNFLESLEAILEQNRVSPGKLWLEITESFFVQDAEEAVGALKAVRELGVPLVLDDFGSAYSSLALLRDVAIELVKLDAGFIRAAGQDQRSRALLQGIIELAHRLDVRVVAEGVESEEQVQILRAMGCDLVQGFHFAPALPLNDSRWSLLLD